MVIIARDHYLEQLIAFKDKQVIKIITGVRRCGKSTLLKIFQDYLLKQNMMKEQLIVINFEDYDFNPLTDPAKLHEYIKLRLIPGKKMYIFLDEIQNVHEFPKVVDSLYIKDDIDMYITGSNAYMLSGEIATLISGRYVEIAMLPLSLREFAVSLGDTDNLSKTYRKYIDTSSFPYAAELNHNKDNLNNYLRGVYSTIVLKDVASRYAITDLMMLESVVRFAFDNIGSQLSTKKISDTMTSFGRKIDVKTVEKYLRALMESYVLYQAKRYNIKGKQYLKTLEKYYVVDIGLRSVLLGSRAFDAGHILENIIYLELLRRSDDVYIGKVDDLEVDFVAMNSSSISYFQVAATVRDPETLKRELRSLQKIQDDYPKFILTLDEDPEADYDGIRRVNALEWLIQ